jgi:hypothetical protein
VTYRLVTSDDRARAIEAIKAAPVGWVARISPPTRNLKQNALLHAELQEIARTRTWCGFELDVEDWKRLMVAAWMRAKGESPVFIPAIDGHGMDVIYKRTSKLTKEEMSDLIEYVIAWKHLKET